MNVFHPAPLPPDPAAVVTPVEIEGVSEMRALLIGLAAPLAAITLPAAPVVALDPASPQFTAGAAAGVTIHRGGPGHSDRSFIGHRRGDDRDRRHRRRDRDFDGFVYLDDREYQGDTAWRANSYNDWWHERPHRSFPRWVANNQDCQRQWWSGGGWRC